MKPDFATLDFDAVPLPSPEAVDGEPGATPEGIELRPRYGPEDAAGLDFTGGRPGIAP